MGLCVVRMFVCVCVRVCGAHCVCVWMWGCVCKYAVRESERGDTPPCTVIHWNTLYHTATYCNTCDTLQYTTPYCNTLTLIDTLHAAASSVSDLFMSVTLFIHHKVVIYSSHVCHDSFIDWCFFFYFIRHSLICDMTHAMHTLLDVPVLCGIDHRVLCVCFCMCVWACLRLLRVYKRVFVCFCVSDIVKNISAIRFVWRFLIETYKYWKWEIRIFVRNK